MNQEQEIHLFFTEGSSDKEYNVYLEDNGDDSYSVFFTYGRRGNPVNEGFKIEDASFSEAKQVFDKLVLSKTKKGYKEE